MENSRRGNEWFATQREGEKKMELSWYCTSIRMQRRGEAKNKVAEEKCKAAHTAALSIDLIRKPRG
jgi:hypothetical protein